MNCKEVIFVSGLRKEIEVTATKDAGVTANANSLARKRSLDLPGEQITIRPAKSPNPTGHWLNGKYVSRVVDLSKTQEGRAYANR